MKDIFIGCLLFALGVFIGFELRPILFKEQVIIENPTIIMPIESKTDVDDTSPSFGNPPLEILPTPK